MALEPPDLPSETEPSAIADERRLEDLEGPGSAPLAQPELPEATKIPPTANPKAIQISQLPEGEMVFECSHIRLEAFAKGDSDTRKKHSWQRTASTVASVATAIAVVVAAGAFLLQWGSLDEQRLSEQKSDQATRYSAISSAELDLDKTLAEHPDFLACLEVGGCEASPTPQQSRTWRQLAYYVLDFYLYVYDQNFSLGATPKDGRLVLSKDALAPEYPDLVTWSETIAGGLRDSVFLCDALRENKDAYGARFVDDVKSRDLCKP